MMKTDANQLIDSIKTPPDINSNTTSGDKVKLSLSFTRVKPKEKIKVYLETSNGILELTLNKIHKTEMSNGLIVLRGKSFDEN